MIHALILILITYYLELDISLSINVYILLCRKFYKKKRFVIDNNFVIILGISNSFFRYLFTFCRTNKNRIIMNHKMLLHV